MRGLALLLLAGCPREVPPHLLVQSQALEMEAASFDTLPSTLTWMLGTDPIARTARFPENAVFERLEGTSDLATLARSIRALEAGDGEPALELQRSTGPSAGLAAPFTRGYLLARAENLLAGLTPSAGQPPLHAYITPLRRQASDEALPRDPLSFLEDTDARRFYGERWVLTSWLSQPDHPLEPVQAALANPQHSRLATTPTGRLLLSSHGASDAPVGPGMALLERATLLSLTRAAADRDTEQAAWADLKLDAMEELQTQDPEHALLDASFEGLLPASADRTARGAALVAIAADRWRGGCTDEPCDGLDRTETFAMARTFGPEVERLAVVWQVIALKDALDSMEAGKDTVLFPRAALQLADALHGTGAGPIDASLLMRSRPSPATWLSLARATGGETATDWGTARNRLAQHVTGVVDQALLHHEDGPLKPLLERVRERVAR